MTPEVTPLNIPALLAVCERLLARWDSDYITTPDLKVFPAHVRLVKGLCETVQGCYAHTTVRPERCLVCEDKRKLLAEFAADPQVRRMMEEGA